MNRPRPPYPDAFVPKPYRAVAIEVDEVEPGAQGLFRHKPSWITGVDFISKERSRTLQIFLPVAAE